MLRRTVLVIRNELMLFYSSHFRGLNKPDLLTSLAFTQDGACNTQIVNCCYMYTWKYCSPFLLYCNYFMLEQVLETTEKMKFK